MSFLLNFTDVLKFVGGGDNQRKYVQGQEVLNAAHIMYCAITKQMHSSWEILGLCLQSSGVNTKLPHELNLVVNYETTPQGPSAKISCKCSCIAGLLGNCKHSVALLVHLTR